MSIFIDAVMKTTSQGDHDLRFYWDGVVRRWTADIEHDSGAAGSWEVRLNGTRLGLWIDLEPERVRFEDAGVYAHMVAAAHYNPTTSGWSLIGSDGPLFCAMFAGLAARYESRADARFK